MDARQILEDTPKLLNDLDQRLLEMEFEAEDKRDLIRRRLTGVAAQVATERDDAGKPRFGNEALRENEVNWRLSDDAGYQQLRRDVRDLERRIANDKNEREFQKNLQVNARVLLLAASQLEALHA